jgi:hypothetical protein
MFSGCCCLFFQVDFENVIFDRVLDTQDTSGSLKLCLAGEREENAKIGYKVNFVLTTVVWKETKT